MSKSNFRNAMISIYKKALAKPTRAGKIEELTVFIEFLTFEVRRRKEQRRNRLDN